MKRGQLERDLMRVLPTGVTRGRPNPLHHDFPLRLRKARQAAGLSMAALCDQAGMGRSTVSQLEAKRGVPRLFTVERLADALEVSAGWLAYGVDSTWAPATELRCKGLTAKLRQLRQEQELSLRDLAMAAGATAPAIGMLEGGALPTLAALENLAVALGVSPAWLAYGEGPRELPRRGARGLLSDAETASH